MKRSAYSLFSLVVFITLLSGCSSQPGTEHAVAPKDTEKVEETNQPVQPSPAIEEEKAQVQLFMTDEMALEVVETQAELSYSSETKYETLFQALSIPQGDHAVTLWEDWSLIDSSLVDGVLTLNLDGPEEAVGSSIERLMLLTLLKTMFQFSEVEQVQLFINGEKKQTLSGHMDIHDPFKKQDLADL
ncbi:GerMN domain-containing protein [Ammoniphilus sp. YIM 78166]|uniref:GerMN domain-containing protein n=1 Tax=Ammoniphilus sp. YIM 78166 TaxID=1644106 RepID=UPI00106F2746|nr:GerMN domain-containing protein [Ammoniphilus sp. YIM 78166]